MPATNGMVAIDPREILEPYPGLRPFLDHEHALLKGRGDQIREVLVRLEKTHFVAIIGGSGSGKSSLIRAGVVPRLRSQAIPAAGDYWIPVVFTPGTTEPSDGATAAARADAESPVTRLAWKFAQAMLKPGEPAVDLKLRDEVAAFFRQGAGFSRLVRAYHHLLPRPGPKTDKARFLFVIDQFEELFHPNNCDNADARTVVDAVIEHFLQPDDRAYVVMTMRSEHLADCAAFLRLPDAINRSFYLVRRLDPAELREVIVEPAQVMLRSVQRSDASRTEPVAFAPEVVARLLADARRIEDDPDHLPLLQHLLARTWSAALAREGLPEQDAAPQQVTMADLEAAVSPGVVLAAGWLAKDRRLNSLRSSLENWAEHLYRLRNPEQQAQLTEVLRHLAFKDPNTGLYFQQRIDVDDPRLLEGLPQLRAVLLGLLERGFLDTVNYLFWDDENPAHVTLKVSHESFIRGWTRFRKIVDREADRFDEFVTVLRRCLLWQEGGRPEDLLLEAAELVRIQGAGLNPVFDDAEECESWIGVLRLCRDGDRLAAVQPSLAPFVAASRARQKWRKDEAEEAQRRAQASLEAERTAREEARIAKAQQEADAVAAEARRRQDEAERARAHEEVGRIQAEIERTKEAGRRKNAIIVGFAAVAVLLLLASAYGWLIREPAMRSITHFNTARALASTRDLSNGSYEDGAAARELKSLRDAAEQVLEGRAGEAFSLLPFGANALRDALGGIPGVGNTLVGEQLQQVEASSSELTVNQELRSLLTTALWRPAKASVLEPLVTPLAAKGDSKSCVVLPGAAPVKGSWLFVGNSRRGLFVPDPSQGAARPQHSGAAFDDLVIYNAMREGADCKARSVAFSLPRQLEPAVIFDARLTVMAAVNRRGSDGKAGLTLFDIDWGWNDRENDFVAQFKQRRWVNSPLADPVYAFVPKDEELAVVPTRAIRGGIEVQVGVDRRALLSSEAQPVEPSAIETGFRKLKALERVSVEPPAAGTGFGRWLKPEESPGTLCKRLGEKTREKATAQPDPSGQHRKLADASAFHDEIDGLCFVVQTYDPAARPASGASPGSARESGRTGHDEVVASEEVTVSVYPDVSIRAAALGMSDGEPEFPLAPAASWKFMNRIGQTAHDWWVGKTAGAWDGYLAATPSGRLEGAVAAPFNTAALKRLADELLKHNPPPAGAAEKPAKASAPTR